MKKEKGGYSHLKLSIILFLSLFLISIVSAQITCNPSSLSTSYPQGSNASLITVCTNSANYSVAVSKTGSDFTLDKSILLNGTSTTIQVTFNPSASVATHSGSIDFNDSSSSIPVLFIVTSPPSPSDMLVFPTSKVISVQQGDEKTQNVILTLPSTYPRTVTIQSVDFNPQVSPIKFGDLNLGSISPGQSIQIPIIFSGIGASTGVYQTQMSVFAVDSQGQVPVSNVNLQLQVTSGINPLTNSSLDNFPTCTVSSTLLNLNSTYQLTCTLSNPNVQIYPVIDPEFIQGVTVDQTANQYIYSFKGIKTGNTNVTAKFVYQNGEVGKRFSQEVKITPSGATSVGGTIMDVIFYQNGQQIPLSDLKATDTIINLVDNSTRNLITNYHLLLNGVEINNTLSFTTGKTYELRATASDMGYSDRVLDFNVSAAGLLILLDPSKETYNLGDIINLSSNVENVSYLLGDSVITSPYTFVSAGTYVLKAVKEGYLDGEMNITVLSPISYTTLSPNDPSKWKKNDDVSMLLTDNASWTVTYVPKANPTQTPVALKSGIGNLVSFKVQGDGVYRVLDGNTEITSFNIGNSRSLWNTLSSHPWLFGIIGAVVLLIIIILFIRNRNSAHNEVPMGGGSPSSSQSEFGES